MLSAYSMIEQDPGIEEEPGAAPRVGRRWALRDATAQAHSGLEAVVGSFDDLDAYRRYLRGMAAFRHAIEPALSDWRPPVDFQDFRPTLIAEDLDRDLADLGLDAPPPERLEDAFRGPDSALGLLYVTEGSNLGACLLTPRAGRLGLHARCGARHLHRQKAASRQWRRFQALLEESPMEFGRAAQAAIDAFDAARRAMDRAAQRGGWRDGG